MDEPAETSFVSGLQLRGGLDVLETWSASASQAERSAVYQALFAVLDGSVFRTYRTLEAPICRSRT